MKQIRIILTTLFVLFFLLSFSQTIELKTKERINKLQQSGIDTIVCYFQYCSKDIRTIEDSSCRISLTRYILWINNGKQFKQKIDESEISNVYKIDNSLFLNTVVNNIELIKTSQIKPVEHTQEEKLVFTEIGVNTIITHFEFFIGQSSFVKNINHFDIETKLFGDKTKNENYEINQKSILNKLKELIGKEI